jgi:hypoxanthine phosphoribosyltransferase
LTSNKRSSPLITSYLSGTKSCMQRQLPLPKGRKYLIVDDIYDTGDTFNKVYAMVKEFDYDFAFL